MNKNTPLYAGFVGRGSWLLVGHEGEAIQAATMRPASDKGCQDWRRGEPIDALRRLAHIRKRNSDEQGNLDILPAMNGRDSYGVPAGFAGISSVGSSHLTGLCALILG